MEPLRPLPISTRQRRFWPRRCGCRSSLSPPFPCFFVSRCATVSPLIAQDLSKAASVEVDDMLRFFVAQIVLDKTKPIKDMMPETKEYLEQIREVVKPIVAASQSREPGSPQNLLTQLTTLYVYQLQVVSISVLIGGAFQSRYQD
jgi:antitoxin component of RelBE/YafQ-DinJ toxin-antitoxin module